MKKFKATAKEVPYLNKALTEEDCGPWTVHSDGTFEADMTWKRANAVKQRSFDLYEYYESFTPLLSDDEVFNGKNPPAEDEIRVGVINNRQWRREKQFHGLDVD